MTIMAPRYVTIIDSSGRARTFQIEGPVTELDGDEETHAGELFKSRYPFLGDGAMHTHYWRLDAQEVIYMHTDGKSADETASSLGQTWAKSKAPWSR